MVEVVCDVGPERQPKRLNLHWSLVCSLDSSRAPRPGSPTHAGLPSGSLPVRRFECSAPRMGSAPDRARTGKAGLPLAWDRRPGGADWRLLIGPGSGDPGPRAAASGRTGPFGLAHRQEPVYADWRCVRMLALPRGDWRHPPAWCEPTCAPNGPWAPSAGLSGNLPQLRSLLLFEQPVATKLPLPDDRFACLNVRSSLGNIRWLSVICDGRAELVLRDLAVRGCERACLSQQST